MAEQKLCKECGRGQTFENRARCRDCQNAKRRAEYAKGGYGAKKDKRRANWRREFMDAVKNLPCQDCERRYPPECMDFDHRDAELKEFEIGSTYIGFNALSKLQREISKCDLVCANCHRIRTAKRRKNTCGG